MNERPSAEIVYEMIRTGDMSENEFVEWALEEFNEGYGCGANTCCGS